MGTIDPTEVCESATHGYHRPQRRSRSTHEWLCLNARMGDNWPREGRVFEFQGVVDSFTWGQCLLGWVRRLLWLGTATPLVGSVDSFISSRRLLHMKSLNPRAGFMERTKESFRLLRTECADSFRRRR